ncbi:hypothetical protein MAIT1_03788 [Magnetofaba australis IT-1]|uniref:Uncharacterized protein n=1 Tax=Magnetofaba australis IT-1 TaxID=1434232 RepID=A0A1Y2K3W5_9PROT|nr:hypothetical protein MAIT1_03788 [Magnetofaba australis IT-1]
MRPYPPESIQETAARKSDLQLLRDLDATIGGYHSPVDGRWIDSRQARREDLKRHGCREYDPGEKRAFLQEKQSRENALVDRARATLHRRFHDS